MHPTPTLTKLYFFNPLPYLYLQPHFFTPLPYLYQQPYGPSTPYPPSSDQQAQAQQLEEQAAKLEQQGALMAQQANKLADMQTAVGDTPKVGRGRRGWDDRGWQKIRSLFATQNVEGVSRL